MASSVSTSDALRSAVATPIFQRGLTVLARATGCTCLLFDLNGDVVLGPVPGSSWDRTVLCSERGRDLTVAVHLRCAGLIDGAGGGPVMDTMLDTLDYMSVPVQIGDTHGAILTLGGRPREPVPETIIERVAAYMETSPSVLREASRGLIPWSPEDASHCWELASVMGELMGAFCAQNTDLQHRLDELGAVYSISEMVSGSLDLREVLHRIARLICEVMNAKACGIRLLDDETRTLSMTATYNLSEEYLSKGPVTLDDNPVDAAVLEGEVVRIADAPNDPRTRYPEQARREGIVSLMVCGMIHRNKPLGVLRVYTGEPHVFSQYEQSLLRAVAFQAATAIVNTRLLSATIEAERNARQLAYAGEVQRRMIPAEPPRYRGADIGAVYRPTFQVGGDFYDFIPLPKNNLGIAIADVSGKGVPASLQMASVRAALRLSAYHMYDIDRILAEVNRHLCHDTTVGEFATVFYGVFKPDTGRLTYCNAGHDPPILLRGHDVLYLTTGGLVLGVDPDATFERGIVDLRPGDVLLFYTDGAVEALNFADEQYGRQRLVTSLRRYADQPASRIVRNLLWDLRRFRGLADRVDDVTLVSLKICGDRMT